MNIIEVELLSNNLALTEKFYTEVLGLQPYLKHHQSALFFMVGYTRLIFRKAENINPVYHFAIDVPNNLFKEAYKNIKQKVSLLDIDGVDDIAHFTNWDAESFYFYDNNRNIVEVITRYGNAAHASPPFSSASYIALSEISIVTADVPALARRLQKEHGIPAFYRQPPSGTFTVSGDDNGLFILAQKGRESYPVKDKAQVFYTRIVFLNQGNVDYISII